MYIYIYIYTYTYTHIFLLKRSGSLLHVLFYSDAMQKEFLGSLSHSRALRPSHLKIGPFKPLHFCVGGTLTLRI